MRGAFIFNRHCRCPKVGPGIGLVRCKPGRRVQDREIGGSDTRSQFIPFKWHRDSSAWTCSGRIGRNGCRAALVAQIIDENLALALRLGDRRDIEVRTVGRHGIGDGFGESLDFRPSRLGFYRRHHMQALAAGRLDESLKAGLLDPLAGFLCGGDDLLPRNSSPGSRSMMMMSGRSQSLTVEPQG